MHEMATSSHCKTILSKSLPAIAERDSELDRQVTRIVKKYIINNGIASRCELLPLFFFRG